MGSGTGRKPNSVTVGQPKIDAFFQRRPSLQQPLRYWNGRPVLQSADRPPGPVSPHVAPPSGSDIFKPVVFPVPAINPVRSAGNVYALPSSSQNSTGISSSRPVIFPQHGSQARNPFQSYASPRSPFQPRVPNGSQAVRSYRQDGPSQSFGQSFAPSAVATNRFAAPHPPSGIAVGGNLTISTAKPTLNPFLQPLRGASLAPHVPRAAPTQAQQAAVQNSFEDDDADFADLVSEYESTQPAPPVAVAETKKSAPTLIPDQDIIADAENADLFADWETESAVSHVTASSVSVNSDARRSGSGVSSMVSHGNSGGWPAPSDDRKPITSTAEILEDLPPATQVPANVQPLSGFDLRAGLKWVYPTTFPVRDYQYNIVQKALFRNTMVCLPTGLGKTFIAAVVMYNFYLWYPEGKIIFVAPTKPLVDQQMKACYDVMGISQDDMVKLTSETASSRRQDIWASKRVFFLTPQIAVNDLERNVYNPKDVCCIVVDEAHKSTGNHHYVQLVRLLSAAHKQFRVLALSATPGKDSPTIQTVLTNLMINHVEIRQENSIDVVQYVHHKHIENIVVKMDETMRTVMDRLMDVIIPYVDCLKRHKQLSNTSSNPREIARYAVLTSSQGFRMVAQNYPKYVKDEIGRAYGMLLGLYHAYELLQFYGMRPFYHFLHDTIRNGENKLISHMLERHGLLQELIGDVKSWLGFDLTALGGASLHLDEDTPYVYGHPKLKKLDEIVMEYFTPPEVEVVEAGTPKRDNENSRIIVFSSFRDSVTEIVDMLKRHGPTVRVAKFVGQASAGKNQISGKRGMTQKEQAEIIQQFRNGDCNVLVATCVGEEGLDIGEVDLVICFDPQASAIRSVQRTGRTGRKRRGRSVFLLAEGKEEQKAKKCLSSKTSVEKTLLRFTGFHMYEENPRMVPGGLRPVCVKLKLQVPAFNTEIMREGSSSSKKGKIKRRQSCRSDDEFSKAKEKQKCLSDDDECSKSKKITERKKKHRRKYLTDEAFVEWKDEYRVLASEVPILPESRFVYDFAAGSSFVEKFKRHSKDDAHSAEARLSVGNHPIQQHMRQGAYFASTSERSSDLVTVMRQLNDFPMDIRQDACDIGFRRFYRKACRAGYVDLAWDTSDDSDYSEENGSLLAFPAEVPEDGDDVPSAADSAATNVQPESRRRQPEPSRLPEAADGVQENKDEQTGMVDPPVGSADRPEPYLIPSDVEQKKLRPKINLSKIREAADGISDTSFDILNVERRDKLMSRAPQKGRSSGGNVEPLPAGSRACCEAVSHETPRKTEDNIDLDDWGDWEENGGQGIDDEPSAAEPLGRFPEEPSGPGEDITENRDLLSESAMLAFINEATINVPETPSFEQRRKTSKQNATGARMFDNTGGIGGRSFADDEERLPFGDRKGLNAGNSEGTEEEFVLKFPPVDLLPKPPNRILASDTILPSFSDGPLCHSTPLAKKARSRVISAPNLSPVVERSKEPTSASRVNETLLTDDEDGVDVVKNSFTEEDEAPVAPLESEARVSKPQPVTPSKSRRSVLTSLSPDDPSKLWSPKKKQKEKLNAKGTGSRSNLPGFKAPIRSQTPKKTPLPAKRSSRDAFVKSDFDRNGMAKPNKKSPAAKRSSAADLDRNEMTKPNKKSPTPKHSTTAVVPSCSAVRSESPDEDEVVFFGRKRPVAAFETPSTEERGAQEKAAGSRVVQNSFTGKPQKTRPALKLVTEDTPVARIKRRFQALDFLDMEANVSGNDGSGDESDNDKEENYPSSFVATSDGSDEINPTYMHAVYARDQIESPDMNKLLRRLGPKKFRTEDIYSQPFQQDEDYGSDSFVAYSDEEETPPPRKRKT